jgi:peptidoglycan/LPS O-acetylase OafA/YrhL
MSSHAAPAAPASATTPAAPVATPSGHFPGLEGLRALAASLVVLTHAGDLAGPARAGWLLKPAAVGDVGVAVFFVLSGFLIYRPFVRSHLAGRAPARARTFWWRRALRIFPAYWAALTFFWALGFYSLGADWWKYYLLLQIYGAFTTFNGIIQAWSIATEVSFYFMIPFWSGLLRRVIGRGRTTVRIEAAGVTVLFAIGYLSRALFSASHRYAVPPHFMGSDSQGTFLRQVAFSWLPNQIDLFAIGMGVAVLWAWGEQTGRLDDLGRWLGRGAGWWWAAAFGTFLVITYVLGAAPVAVGNVGAHWQARQSLYGLFGLLLLVPLVYGDQSVGGVRRTLRLRPIVWVGVVSYGFYLYHLDFMVRFSQHVPRAQRIASRLGLPDDWAGTGRGNLNLLLIILVGFVCGLSAAAVSWYALEKPLSHFKGRL